MQNDYLPVFEDINLAYYSNEEKISYISQLCDYMKQRDKEIKRVEQEKKDNPPPNYGIDDIPF